MARWSAAAGLTVKVLLTALVKPLALAVNCLLVPAESISRLVKVATALPAVVPMSKLVVPTRGPVPVVKVRVTILLAGRPGVETLPNWSRARTPGCVARVGPVGGEAGGVGN